MRQQTAQHTYVVPRRASLPAPVYQQQAPPASRHRAGHHPGMHPEDMPYTTHTRYRPPPSYDTKYSTEDDEEYRYPHHTRSSVIVRQQPYASVEPVTQTGEWEEQQSYHRRGWHPLVYLGVCLFIVFGFLTAYILIPPAVQKWNDDRAYGYPRTFQTDANVGHGGVSHFLVMNVHGTIEVVEILPDPRKNPPHLYLIAQFADHGADLVAATISFSDLNGDGKPDMQVTVYNGTNPTIYVLFNDGTQFKPKL